MNRACSSTSTVSQAENERDEIDVPKSVEGRDHRQDQQERPKNDHEFVELHRPIWPGDHVNGLIRVKKLEVLMEFNCIVPDQLQLLGTLV